ncbi:MAG: hypothetical protein LRS49_02645 [Desulfurococcales archaeon]|nr:hypothetical protein [Desulfurococcales archaeon]
MHSATIAGSELFRAVLASPLVLAIGASTAAGAAALALASRRGLRIPGMPETRRAAYLLAAAIIAVYAVVVPAAAYYSARPGLDYGVWVDGANVTVRFYGTATVSFNLCNATLNLTDTQRALSMLSVRTNGLSDPTAGVHMGYYKTKSGARAYVIVYEKRAPKALVARLPDGSYVIAAVPGVESLYREVSGERPGLCGQASSHS